MVALLLFKSVTECFLPPKANESTLDVCAFWNFRFLQPLLNLLEIESIGPPLIILLHESHVPNYSRDIGWYVLRDLDNLCYDWLTCMWICRTAHDKPRSTVSANNFPLYRQLSTMTPLLHWCLRSVFPRRIVSECIKLVVLHYTIVACLSIGIVSVIVMVVLISKLVKSECVAFTHHLVSVRLVSLPFLLAFFHFYMDQLIVFLSLLDPFSLKGLLLFPQLTQYVRVCIGIANYARTAHRAMETCLGSCWNGMATGTRCMWLVTHATSCRVQTATWFLPLYLALILLIRSTFIGSTCLLTWHRYVLTATFPKMLFVDCHTSSLIVILCGFQRFILAHALLEEIFSWPDIILLVKISLLIFLRVWSF